MTTTKNFLGALISKLVTVRAFVKNEVENPNKHPEPQPRLKLEGFLRITQGELVEGFGVKSPKKLTVTVRKAMAVLARIHKGSDSYRVIAEKAEVLIKRLHPLYVAELERVKLENAKRAMREKLEKSFHVLSGGKALPVGIETAQLSDFVSDLRDELEHDVVRLMDEVSESAFRHPDVGRISDENLVAFKARNEIATNQRKLREPMRRAHQSAHSRGITKLGFEDYLRKEGFEHLLK